MLLPLPLSLRGLFITDDDGELLLLLDNDIEEDCELLNRPERRALALDFVGMLFDDDRGDVCSGGVGGLATLSTSPLLLPLLLPDFFLRDGILPIFFFDVDGIADDDDSLVAVLILQQLQYYTSKFCSLLMLVSCVFKLFFSATIGTSLANAYHVHL